MSLRASKPLFLWFTLRKAADEHKAWVKQTYLNVTELLVTDVLKVFKERGAYAARCEAVLVGNGGLVTCYSRSRSLHVTTGHSTNFLVHAPLQSP
jgi:hypothetical protein